VLPHDSLLDDFEAANLDAGRQRETPCHEGLFYRGPVGAGWVCQQEAFVAQVVQANACFLIPSGVLYQKVQHLRGFG